MKITAAESLVMEALWRKDGPVDVEDILATFPDEGWTGGSVRTLLNRLAAKKAVAIIRDRRRVLFQPLLDRGDYVHAQTRGLVDRLFGGELAPLVAHFTKRKDLSPTDIAKLKALVESLEEDDA